MAAHPDKARMHVVCDNARYYNRTYARKGKLGKNAFLLGLTQLKDCLVINKVLPKKQKLP